MGAIKLGQETDKHFILDLLPDGYEEKVYEEENFYSCACKNISGNYMDGKDGDDGSWEKFVEKLREEFGDNLIEVYSITSSGAHFVVYLKKEKND